MAIPSRKLTEADAALVRALDERGWLQSDIASLLGCNIGRVSEVIAGSRHPGVPAADLNCDEVRSRMLPILNDWNLRISRQLAALLRPHGSLI